MLWVDWRHYIEYWRLYQSGQFVHLFAFSEDEVKSKAVERFSQLVWGPEGFRPSGHVEFLSALYRLTEIFEFRARLATAGALDERPVIKIGMHQVRDRVMMSTEADRWFDGCYRASQDSLEHSWSTSSLELISNSARLAIDATLWSFERFGWQDPAKETLELEQAEFLARAYRRDLSR